MTVAPWRVRAACVDAPLPMVDEVFRKPGGAVAEEFKRRFCQHCDVAEQCLLAAMERHEFGVWGSTSANWRTRHGGPKSPGYVRARAAA
jgi:hypothetical protein